MALPLVAVGFTVAAYALWYGNRDAGPSGMLGPLPNDPGVVHVHGLGVNPANGDVYAATHMGIFRISDGGEAVRLANRYQDTMGFTVVGPDHFLASGHPDLREELPPLLGLLESRDGGHTWSARSLLGEADFHVLRYVHGAIYGYDSTGGAVMVSRDGRRWDTRSKLAIFDLVVSPGDPDELVSSVPGGVQRSRDGGRTWQGVAGPAQAAFLAWSSPERLLLLDGAGRLHVSSDRGETWEARGPSLGPPQALLDHEDKVYAAVDGGIFVSADDGRTWQVFYRSAGMH